MPDVTVQIQTPDDTTLRRFGGTIYVGGILDGAGAGNLTVSVNDPGGMVTLTAATLVHFEELAPNRYRWVFRVVVTQGIADADVDITVTPTHLQPGHTPVPDTVAVTVKRAVFASVASILHPGPGHEISGTEREYFIAFGTFTSLLTRADLGTLRGVLHYTDAVTWWAEFYDDLPTNPGPGPQTLTVDSLAGPSSVDVEIN